MKNNSYLIAIFVLGLAFSCSQSGEEMVDYTKLSDEERTKLAKDPAQFPKIPIITCIENT